MAPEVEVEVSRVEEILDPQEHLDPVKRLGQEVLGAGLQRALLRLGGRIGREDQDREIDILGDLKLSHDGDPIQIRHHQVEQEQIRLILTVQGEHLPGIRGAANLPIAGLGQRALEEPNVRRLIVDDEDSRLGEIHCPHGSPHGFGRAFVQTSKFLESQKGATP